MARDIFTIGTSHKYQRPDPKLSVEQIEAFEKEIREICLHYNISILAEENNLQAQQNHNLGDSLPYKVATSLSINHLYCDPDRATRIQHGIRQHNDILASHILDDDISDEDIARELQESYEIRERYWLEEISRSNNWPVLFICGADHITSLINQAGRLGYNLNVLHSDWYA